MKLTYGWLKDFIDLRIKPVEVANLLTCIGLEVSRAGIEYESNNMVVVGKVIEKRPIPESDRLSLCSVNVGGEKPLSIVCGARNVSAGQKVPVALEGAKLQNGLKIKKTKIRGEMSEGMICSEAELGISKEAEGIIVLDDQSSVGKVFTREMIAGDIVYDIDILPNRPDCMSVIGVARDISSKLDLDLNEPRIELKQEGKDVNTFVKVQIDAKRECPRYMAKYISEIKIGPSPKWMQERLNFAGLRSINNVVDITNYVLIELGHPLHAFDYDLIKHGKIVVRKAKENEKITTIDGKEQNLSLEHLLICDGERPVAIAGIMGGMNSEVSEKTTKVLLEGAYFDPITIRKGAKKLGISTEASVRFERGTDPNRIEFAMNRAAALMEEYCSAKVSKGSVDIYPEKISECHIKFRPERCNKYLGTDFKPQDIERVFRRLGFLISSMGNEEWIILVPSYRPDIQHEVDLIEEAVRIIGYDHIPVNNSITHSIIVKRNARDGFLKSLREAMVGFGFCEVVTNSLCDSKEIERLGVGESLVRLLNPLSPELSVLRPSLLPSLLKVASWNLNRKIEDLAIFEIGKCFFSKGKNSLAEEKDYIAALIYGRNRPMEWSKMARPFDFYQTRGLLQSLFKRLFIENFGVVEADYFMNTGLSVILDKKDIGAFFKISEKNCRDFDIRSKEVYGFELSIDELLISQQKSRRFKPLAKFPPVDRDIALVLGNEIGPSEIVEFIKNYSPLVEKVIIFDIYKGKELGEGKKSIAFSIRLRSGEQTLNDKTIEHFFNGLILRLNKRFNSHLR